MKEQKYFITLNERTEEEAIQKMKALSFFAQILTPKQIAGFADAVKRDRSKLNMILNALNL